MRYDGSDTVVVLVDAFCRLGRVGGLGSIAGYDEEQHMLDTGLALGDVEKPACGAWREGYDVARPHIDESVVAPFIPGDAPPPRDGHERLIGVVIVHKGAAARFGAGEAKVEPFRDRDR